MTRKYKPMIVIGAVLATIALVYLIALPLSWPMRVQETCVTPDLGMIEAKSSSPAELKQCLENQARIFLESEYVEVKDLSKSLLTLLTATLIASIAFSEKIVDIQNSKRTSLLAMIFCWFTIILSIALIGSSLMMMMTAATQAAYHPSLERERISTHGMVLFMFGCLSAGASLVSLVLAGTISLYDKRMASQATAPS